MRKYFVAVCMLITVLFIGANSYALDVWGLIADEQGVGIPYAQVVISDPNAGPITTVTAGSTGWYVWHKPGGYCEYKILTATAAGFANRSKNVTDNSCPDCYPQCPDENEDGYPDACRTCKANIIVHFTLLPGTSDRDVDGVVDGSDNCPTTPNGPRRGTCNSGSKRGQACSTQIIGVCGCAANPIPCDMFQTDANGNGVGDVCEVAGASLLTEDAEVHSVFTTQGTSPDVLFAAVWVYITTHIKGVGQFDTFPEFVFAMQNLPLFWYTCGYPVIDENGNNIADGEEGLIPVDWTYADYVAAYQKAFMRCFDNQ